MGLGWDEMGRDGTMRIFFSMNLLFLGVPAFLA